MHVFLHVLIWIGAFIGIWAGVARALAKFREERLDAESDDPKPRYEMPADYDPPLTTAELKAMERWFS